MTAEQMSAADKTAPQQNKRKKVVGQSKCNYNHFPPTTQPRPNRPCPVRHSSIRTTTTQPPFVSNPRTISTQPSHIRDSPTSTAIQSQFNLNHKARQRSFPRDTSRNESKALLQGAVSAARRPRKYRVAASRSLSCPRRAASIEGMTPLADASEASEANIEHRTC